MKKDNKQKSDNPHQDKVSKTKINLLHPKIITFSLLLLSIPLILFSAKQNSEIRQRAQKPIEVPSITEPSPTPSVAQIYLISPEITMAPRPHVD